MLWQACMYSQSLYHNCSNKGSWKGPQLLTNRFYSFLRWVSICIPLCLQDRERGSEHSPGVSSTSYSCDGYAVSVDVHHPYNLLHGVKLLCCYFVAILFASLSQFLVLQYPVWENSTELQQKRRCQSNPVIPQRHQRNGEYPWAGESFPSHL